MGERYAVDGGGVSGGEEEVALAGLLAPAHLVLLAVGLVPASHHLQPLVLGGHAPGAGREGGGEGQHGEVFWQLQGGDDGMDRGNKVMEVEIRLEEVVLVKVFVTILWVFSSARIPL